MERGNKHRGGVREEEERERELKTEAERKEKGREPRDKRRKNYGE